MQFFLTLFALVIAMINGQDPTGAPTTMPSSLPTSLPSSAPTSIPTMSPTFSTVVVMQFGASQVLHNVSTDEFKDSDVAQSTFQQAVADSTVDITADDVSILSITAITNTSLRRRLDDEMGDCNVVYNITLIVSNTNYTTPELAYDAVSTALVASVDDGDFTNTLQNLSDASTDPIFADTTTDVIEVTQPTVYEVATGTPTYSPTHKSNGSDDDDDSLALGLGLGLGIPILLLIIFCWKGDEIKECFGCGDDSSLTKPLYGDNGGNPMHKGDKL
eukprot:TRINITY_DN69525_c0_g1_i1.p1 TRINITY_DN69525_c0_g1~~TRINITY_DN69525_c0_g1_i1.p1  ORF type:complete len:274 (-),score=14.81 TRINITY_DN69525_c0_g1_i1:207-1028(-)